MDVGRANGDHHAMRRRCAGPDERARLAALACGLLVLSGCTALKDPGDQLARPAVSQCAGRLVDTETDEQNCGECGVLCPSAGLDCDQPQQCITGACVCLGTSIVPVCAPGFADCGAGCVDLASTKESCGECGNACADDPLCPVPTVCVAGGCVCPGAAPVCPPGGTPCGDLCVDASSDAANCGECGNACADDGVFCNGTAACVAGGCTQVAQPCGAQGCNESTHGCGVCDDPEFPCPAGGSFCEGFLACERRACVVHPRRCEDPALPFCDAGSSSCVACVDDTDCNVDLVCDTSVNRCVAP